MTRTRAWLRFAVVAMLAMAAGAAFAQSFPDPQRPVRLVVGFAAGGGSDIQARLLAPRLAEALGVPVTVDNRPGASTMIAAQEVARAAPDGHTLLYTFNGTFAQNPHTHATVPYDPFRDFTPVSLAARGSMLLVVHSSLPVRSVAELIHYGKTHPGTLNIASFGVGTSSHLYAELLARHAGVPMTHVPYKGAGDAANDLLAGRVQLMFDAAPTALQHAKSGSLRILGIVAPSRTSLLPDVPTLAEQGIRDIDLVGWLGIYGPAKLPPDIVARLNAALVKAIATPEVRAGFAAGAYEAVSSTPEELRALTREAFDDWGKVVRDIGLSPR